jgi:transketolase
LGDLTGNAVDGTLYYASGKQFDRLKNLNAPLELRLALWADLARLNALYMIANAGSGHIGSSFSSLDVVASLYLSELQSDDFYFSSKGHDAPGLYAVLIAQAVLPEERLHQLRRLGGLPGHPDVNTAGMVTNTGSLGMGISKAKGMIFANRLCGKKARAFVMTGDGELQEGQIWESLVSAANQEMGELTVIVDHNKIQSDFSVERTSSLGDVAAKFRAFGWEVDRIDGHDMGSILQTFDRLRGISDRPKVVIADTIKGKGVSFMQGTSIDSDVEMFRFHSGAPQSGDYRRAVQEIIDRLNSGLAMLNVGGIELETVERKPQPAVIAEPSRLIPSYTEALLDQAGRNSGLVALDADLMLDMGLIPFSQTYPERFVECGIAEMDMVSQAGGMALTGLLPVAHSFSCFLSTRPNEQIYNNATEGTKIIYVGGLSGVLPAGPGHSHQSVRDIAALGSIPGLVIVEPSCPAEVAPLFDWCVNVHSGPSFLRLISIPYMLPFVLPKNYKLKLGCGIILRDGGDAAVITYGMVMLTEAIKAAEQLASEGINLKIINLPWLNRIDREWLYETLRDVPSLFTIDNHYVDGGQGDFVLSAVASLRPLLSTRCQKFGLEGVPPSGGNDEVLSAVGLDHASLVRRIKSAL